MADWPKHHLENAEKVTIDSEGHTWEMDGETFVRCLESGGWNFVGRPTPEPPIREWTVQLKKIHYGDVKVRARTVDEACALADADYGQSAEWGETQFDVGDAFDTSQETTT